MNEQLISDQVQWFAANWQRAEWQQNEDPQFHGLYELRLDDVALAWVQSRPSYCDRGHWQAGIEFSPNNPIDFADGIPCYYMSLEVAKRETFDKLLWRVVKTQIPRKSPMIGVNEKHRQRHVMLHRALDELFADYIRHNPDQAHYLEMPFRKLMEWSFEQTMNPTEEP